MSRQPIVSSAHLVSEDAAELSEFEFGLNMAINAYHRWIVRCMAAAGQDGLGALDVLVLHLVNHREREKRLSDLCFLLNVEDSHVVNYSLKKLSKLDLVAADRRGKETFYGTTKEGAALCGKYREVRESCLIASHGALGQENREIGEAARTLRVLSGLYDQAARSAASL
ncbi:MAG: winged helix DNA-binding protein [Rhodospirillaceae bacterium]|jgi:predicted MarR family transcription regulator|nr:winged helix DNA-binding protein [Rhodospirillaceae bacterium]MBT5191026.1 winged helix DNA-binding protein [Rhodospirillaceae bacterium]MBT5896325.1 winged helix DNA-binding protein [Rhodospirillaceae bacterium]MBT6426255.1 winged helix DNA-binding protein [Rhodospirillaceae bacterium]MBT7758369.1 winged helix DNA-binding protein [Rhodospirillaceae bacterium]